MDKKKQIHLFNCDNTYDLFVVEALLRYVEEKLPFNITISKHNFGLQNMTEICENTISRLHIDFAFFVVHANESRLTINENNVGIGYTKVYRALLQATGDKVVVVIGGDSNYRDETEENQNVLSRWALRKVNLQFKEEYRDGRKSFVFSWDEKHREIHEEALLHFFDPNKSGLKFFSTSQSVVAGNSNVDGASGFAQKSLAALDLNPRRQQETRSMAAAKPQGGTADLIILCSDKSTATVVSNMYCLPIMRRPPDVHIGSPSELKSHLAARQVTVSAIIGLLASDLKETALRSKWEKSDCGDLLRTAQRAAEEKVVVIICSDGGITSQNEEKAITGRIKQLLDDKGIVLWWKDHEHSLAETKNLKRAFQLNRSKALPDDSVAKRSMGSKPRQINPAEFMLLLKTRLHRGRISYQERDVQERLQGWTAPDDIANDLMAKWNSTADAELLIYRERKTDNYRVVVNDEKDCQSASELSYSVKEKHSASKPEITCTKRLKAIAEDTSPKVFFLCRDESDTLVMKDLFGDEVLTKDHISSRSPDAATDLLRSTYSVRSFFIVVDARAMEEEVHGKSFKTPYESLLREAKRAVEGKVVIIVCSDKNKVSENDEDDITHRINLLLGDKGIIIWWKGNKPSHLKTKKSKCASHFNRSQILPDDGAAKRPMDFSTRPINPEASTLLLKTRLRHGVISYHNEDVEERLEGWVAPKDVEDNLKKKWRSIADAELLIYLENETEKGLLTLVKGGSKIVQLTDSLRDVWQNISETASAEGGLFPPSSKKRGGSSPLNDK